LKRLRSLERSIRLPGVRVSEHQVVVAPVVAGLVELVELAGDAVGERHGARGALALRGAVLSAHEVAAHPVRAARDDKKRKSYCGNVSYQQTMCSINYRGSTRQRSLGARDIRIFRGAYGR